LEYSVLHSNVKTEGKIKFIEATHSQTSGLAVKGRQWHMRKLIGLFVSDEEKNVL
jgi:hypothetical protein